MIDRHAMCKRNHSFVHQIFVSDFLAHIENFFEYDEFLSGTYVIDLPCTGCGGKSKR